MILSIIGWTRLYGACQIWIFLSGLAMDSVESARAFAVSAASMKQKKKVRRTLTIDSTCNMNCSI